MPATSNSHHHTPMPPVGSLAGSILVEGGRFPWRSFLGHA